MVAYSIYQAPNPLAENVGMRARWYAKARKSAVEIMHFGTVTAFVEHGKPLRGVMASSVFTAAVQVRAKDFANFDRYVVIEQRIGADKQVLVPHWYTPRCSLVELLPAHMHPEIGHCLAGNVGCVGTCWPGGC